MKKILLGSLLSLAMNANASTYVMCHFNSFNTKASESSVAVTSSNNVAIINETNTSKTYYLTYQMFIDKTMIHAENYTVNVLAKGHFEDNRITTSMQRFNKKGNHDASCVVNILGAEKNRIAGGGRITII